MNFDNVGNALLTLFEVASLEGWIDVMNNGLDAPTKLGGIPAINQNPAAAAYFVAFVLFGSFLVMNMFVGAVCDKFGDLKEKAQEAKAEGRVGSGASPLQTERQAKFFENVRGMLRNAPARHPIPPKRSSWHACVSVPAFKIVSWDSSGKGSGKTFDSWVAILILVNVLVMALTVWKEPAKDTFYLVGGTAGEDYQKDDWYELLAYINDIFTFVFVGEMLLKHLGLGTKQYWENGWNQMDGVIVILSVVAFWAENADTSAIPVDPTIFRILRVLGRVRALRVAKSAKNMKGVLQLIDTLLFSLPSLFNITILLFLVLFIYAVLGMNFFGGMALDEPRDYGMYNDHTNFAHFHTAMLMLFRMSTGEMWAGIQRDVMDEYPWAWIYFCSYMIIVASLLFSLLIGVVLDQFGEVLSRDKVDIPDAAYENFFAEWARVDPTATHFITKQKMGAMLLKLQPPFDFPRGRFEEAQDFKESVLTDASGRVHFVDTLLALVKHVMIRQAVEAELNGEEDKEVLARKYAETRNEIDTTRMTDEVAEAIMLKFPTVMKTRPYEPPENVYAANVLQKRVKGKFARKRRALFGAP
jgi:hypothetical protein